MGNIKYLYILMFLSSFSVFSQQAFTISVPNIKKSVGEIQVSVFDTNESFLKEGKEFRIYRFKVTSQSQKFTIKDLPNAEYAFIIYHDINNNKDIDKNFFGIPKEPYGFSKNFKPRFSSPDFQDCSVSVGNTDSITINLL
ncbi:DUF2141 domain-containing protein [Aestuariibaculum lutulentum]|uniref:DUF2141 domain-containing protein n=1 Tax=Aestuariibaculum lutulentum TaxID=2920935 RepID=A0ABS9RKE4_9FLAO|nr:DUF2141 domain-containing protein [Aestuariibaculum lutulentum]MCH4553430.1 DUF2141 domain-containing protein [Aestuariibaculum lutulentum]